jgi:Heterokaryon incompatibility protein (HET)
MEDDSLVIDDNVADSSVANEDGDRWSEMSDESAGLWELSGGSDLAGLRVLDDDLCPVCKRRHFKRLFFQFVGDSAYHFFTRTLAHVKTWSSSCKFCSLTLVALGLEDDLVVRSDDEETLVRSDYPRASGTLKDIESEDLLSYYGHEISPDLHHKGKIYFHLRQWPNISETFRNKGPFHETTHSIQLSLPSKESFAWDSEVYPKLQVLGGRFLSEEFDIEMLKTWLCMSDSAVLLGTHSGNSHNQTATTNGIRIRLIDVFEGQLVTSTTDNLFAALSYVWGGPQQVLLTTETDAQLRKPGAITSNHTRLGRTITDALELCKRLGYQYLWIDALCICQDDKEDMMEQIAHMGRIYHSATLTIVQASGDPETSVHTPLRGFLPGSRKVRQEQVTIQNENVLLTCRPPLLSCYSTFEMEHARLDPAGTIPFSKTLVLYRQTDLLDKRFRSHILRRHSVRT